MIKVEDVVLYCPVDDCGKTFGTNVKELRVHLEVYHDRRTLAETLTGKMDWLNDLERAIVRRHGIEPYAYFHDEFNL